MGGTKGRLKKEREGGHALKTSLNEYKSLPGGFFNGFIKNLPRESSEGENVCLGRHSVNTWETRSSKQLSGSHTHSRCHLGSELFPQPALLVKVSCPRQHRSAIVGKILDS